MQKSCGKYHKDHSLGSMKLLSSRWDFPLFFSSQQNGAETDGGDALSPRAEPGTGMKMKAFQALPAVAGFPHRQTPARLIPTATSTRQPHILGAITFLPHRLLGESVGM